MSKINDLPYGLTQDQRQALFEIIDDMKRPQVMMRLLQGDVGSGKTIVAALALYANYTRRQQGALMVPTETLAKQHFKTIQSLFAANGIQVSLLLGSFNASQKAQVKERLSEGGVDILIGTHALFSEDVKFLNLGLAIIDEQHRFGVNQRDALKDKGAEADLLLMSATPIPRTLALSVYGDLDVSTLMQFPFSNRQVTTRLHHPEDKDIGQAIAAALMNRKRIYVIAPTIQDKTQGTYAVETLFEEYSKLYPHQVSLLHGKLTSEEKEEALNLFASGKKPILISTTVIEVGIDVKEATLMIIYDANHFGLASLHQLRGRIGRDGSHSLCILLTEDFDEEIVSRLEVLVQSNDGFYIAEEDLKRRGPGELLGSKQSGLPEFSYINLVTDFKILEAAKKDVEALKITL
jgi:ATP-dependent DNA helicase RecG